MTSSNNRPMLSATLKDNSELQLPAYASPKLDGIRCRIMGRQAISRSGKVLPNRFLQTWTQMFGSTLEGLDGELIIGPPHGEGVYHRSHSGIMTYDGKPDFTFWVFDRITNPQKPFKARLQEASDLVKEMHVRVDPPRVQLLPHGIVETPEQLVDYEKEKVDYGFEGVILRAPNAPYKNGRSTIKQFGMVKIKRFVDAEAEVIGTRPFFRNANPAELDELGYTKHSSHKANMVREERLGALVCKTLEVLEPSIPMGAEFRIGSGFDFRQREELWQIQDQLRGRLVRFKYLPIGSIDAPRHPIFLGWRHPDDL